MLIVSYAVSDGSSGLKVTVIVSAAPGSISALDKDNVKKDVTVAILPTPVSYTHLTLPTTPYV